MLFSSRSSSLPAAGFPALTCILTIAGNQSPACHRLFIAESVLLPVRPRFSWKENRTFSDPSLMLANGLLVPREQPASTSPARKPPRAARLCLSEQIGEQLQQHMATSWWICVSLKARLKQGRGLYPSMNQRNRKNRGASQNSCFAGLNLVVCIYCSSTGDG